MRNESLEFLKQLLTTPSPSGFEATNQRIWCDYVGQFADEVRTDSYGNAVAILNPGGQPKIMLDGHIDEIGLMIRHIDDRGFIYFQKIGGVDPGIIRAKRVNIHTQRGVVRGVIGALAPHLQERDKEQKVPQLHELCIDIGAKDGKDAKKQVTIGDAITFVDDFEMLNANIAVARGMDNRVGVWAVAETLRLLKTQKPKAAVYACSSIQEETGLNGAQMQVVAHKPDVAIAVDVTHATDVPGMDVKKYGEIKLGGGPAIAFGRENHPLVTQRFQKVAKAKKIELQYETFSTSGGTDAWAFWTKNGGVPSAIVSIPNRYMHSTVEMIDLRDLDATANLLAAFCSDVKKGEQFKVKV